MKRKKERVRPARGSEREKKNPRGKRGDEGGQEEAYSDWNLTVRAHPSAINPEGVIDAGIPRRPSCRASLAGCLDHVVIVDKYFFLSRARARRTRQLNNERRKEAPAR